VWHKHAKGCEALRPDDVAAIAENLANARFGWPTDASDSIQKFLDHLEQHYVHAPVSAGDRALHNLTNPHFIECLQKYDPHLRRAFLRAAKGDGCAASHRAHVLNRNPVSTPYHLRRQQLGGSSGNGITVVFA
jgi:hypothetical protein